MIDIDFYLAVVLILMLVFTAMAVFTRDLLLAVIFSAIEGIFVAVAFYLMMAPDIALTQIAVAVGVATALYIVVLRKTGRWE